MSYWKGVSLRKRRKAGGLGEEKLAELAERLGLKPGVRLVAYGNVYAFRNVGGLGGDGRLWVWAYRLKKNGKTYAEATRLERWELCTTS